MVTIKQLAREAGVSVTTASYSLNGGGRISEKTRQKVLETAAKIGYIPSLSARALKGQYARAVGIFVDGIAGPVYGKIIEGAQERFKAEGWGLIVGILNNPIQQLAQSLVYDSLLAGSIILSGGLFPEKNLLALIKKAPMIVFDIPKDFINRIPRTSRGCRIGIDNSKGMKSLFQEILQHKCRRIIFLRNSSNSWDFNTRENILLELCQKEGLPQPKIISCPCNAQGAYGQVKKTFSQNRDYDCIVAANDEMAIGAVNALKESGFIIPSDIIVTGFDDIEASSWMDPTLTTIKVEYKKLGQLIGDKMLQLVASDKPVFENITFPVELIKRHSTGYSEV